MRLFLSLIIHCLLLLMCTQGYAVSDTPTLVGLLKKYHTYTADFQQTTFGHDGAVVSQSSGLLIVKKPNKFFWETKDPNHQKLYGWGNTLWVYDVDLAQATQRALSQPGQLTPAALLSGSGDELTRYFTITSIDSSASQEVQIFILKANSENASFSTIQVSFKDGKLISLETLNNLGQKTLFKFSNIVLDKVVPDSRFKFNPNLPGVDVLKDPAL